jgi:hypothetical protein
MKIKPHIHLERFGYYSQTIRTNVGNLYKVCVICIVIQLVHACQWHNFFLWNLVEIHFGIARFVFQYLISYTNIPGPISYKDSNFSLVNNHKHQGQ